MPSWRYDVCEVDGERTGECKEGDEDESVSEPDPGSWGRFVRSISASLAINF